MSLETDDFFQSAAGARLLVQSVKDYAIFSLDADGRVASWNAGAERLKQYTRDEIVGRDFSVFYSEDERAAGKPRSGLEQASRIGRFEDEGWRIRKDGSRFWADVVITPILDERGRVRGFAKVTRDMTERRRAEESLRRLNEELEMRAQERMKELARTQTRLELALDAGGLGTWEWEPDTGKVTWSTPLKRLFGVPDDFVETMAAFAERVHPDDRARVLDQLGSAAARTDPFHLEYRVVWPSGEVHWVEALGRIVQATPPLVVGTAANIDARLAVRQHLETLVQERTAALSAAQSSLVQAAKLAALGEMAGGIAHELNTPLTVVTMMSQKLAAVARSASPEIAARIETGCKTIEDTAGRMAAIVRGLRSFARDGQRDPKTEVSVRGLLDDVLSLCRMRFESHGVSLRYAPPPAELTVTCRVVPIEQVMLNLLNNAFDAAEDSESKWIAVSVSRQEDQVELRVEDSGKGVAPAIRDKILQPFFTTKPVGKGTGLGLSVSLAIVQDHEGALFLDEASPHTRFVVRLPCRPGGHEPAERERAP